jgi:hypothetical protein
MKQISVKRSGYNPTPGDLLYTYFKGNYISVIFGYEGPEVLKITKHFLSQEETVQSVTEWKNSCMFWLL